MDHDVFIVACSPRKGGNSDAAAEAARLSLPVPANIVRVADAAVAPCQSCGYCLLHPGQCAIDGQGDGAAEIFERMAGASLTIAVCPVYFYHVPAQAKAWIDRSQRYWALPACRKPAKGKAMTAIFVAARQNGEKLFDGASLTLRYMAQNMGMEWIPPLCLRGADGNDSLKGNANALARIEQFVLNAWHERKGQ